jgi:hypothetical protein
MPAALGGSVRVAGSPTKRWLFRGRIPYGRACPTPGLRDLGDESVEDDLRARSAPGETAQLCRRLQRSNFLIGRCPCGSR